eukprot:2960424-Rhodomonas_salina.2
MHRTRGAFAPAPHARNARAPTERPHLELDAVTVRGHRGIVRVSCSPRYSSHSCLPPRLSLLLRSRPPPARVQER